MNHKQKYGNFVEVVATHAGQSPQTNVLTFIPERGEAAFVSNFDNLHNKAKNIAGYLKENTRPGDRALLIYEKDIEFVYAFIGCLYAGVIAVPVFPPTYFGMLARMKHIVKNAAPTVLLTDKGVSAFIEKERNTNEVYKSLNPVNTDELEEIWSDNYSPVSLNHDSLAFLQYTSGSTGNPKGVMVTHGNLLHNEEMMKQWTGHDENSVMVSCLPLYHDMGLVGNVLQSLYVGYPVILMPNQRLLRSPLSWLKTISDYKATTSGGPNFVYELCIRAANPKRIRQLDLSTWNLAFVGAEPVRHQTMQRFAETFAPCGFRPESIYPCYGMAEATLTITAGIKGRKPAIICAEKKALGEKRVIELPTESEEGMILVSNGINMTTHRVEIVDPDSLDICAETEIGEIWLKGPSIAAGYWRNPDLTEKAFNARLANGDGPFFRTGDLGFISNGGLYCSGRLKDVIIINGKNYYPQDIEAVVESCHPKIRFSRVAAFSFITESEEKLCVVAEYKGNQDSTDQTFKAIRMAISRDFGLKASEIVLVKSRSLPFTTSGKVRRNEIKERFSAEKLDVIARMRASESAVSDSAVQEDDHTRTIEKRILVFVAARLGLPAEEIDSDAPLGEYGLTSVDAVQLAEELETFTGTPFSPTLIYENPTIRSLTQLVRKLSPNKTLQQNSSIKIQENDDPIAVIGMACNFPLAPDLDAFWEVLEKGIHAIRQIPDNRRSLTSEGVTMENSACNWGGFIEGADWFDAKFFNISAAEAELMDPQHRKLMEVVWTAIENAGYATSHLSGSSTGIFAGVGSHDYSQLVCGQSLPASAYAATGLSHAMLSNRLSYLLNLHGPSETIDTACSSALVAVHRAVQSIRSGECRQAIAGGVNLLLSPHAYLALGNGGFLSPDGMCRPFDAAANGYVRGEGAGAVFLKPLSKAIKDKDHVYALIKGSAMNHGGRTASLTAPSENAQADLIKQAYDNAGVPAQSITYIEAHGTGTALGDPIEINGLKKAFANGSALNHEDDQQYSCGLGSVKSNIGHLEAAAGIAGLIKTVLALKHKTIPATINFNKKNPYIQIENTPFYIADESKAWVSLKSKEGKAIPRRAGVSSFGFGGTYAHVVLEEAKEALNTVEEAEKGCLIPLSAKTPEALETKIENLHDFLETQTNRLDDQAIQLKDIAFTLQTGRDHYAVRAVFLPRSLAGLKKLLQEAVSREIDKTSLLFEEESHSEDPKKSGLREMARSWLKGADIDWVGWTENSSGNKIPLPGYLFEKKSFWAPVASNQTVIAEDRFKSLPRATTVQEVTQWLVDKVARHTGMPATEIDPQGTFEELGLDSIALIDIHSRIQKYFNLELDISVIQEYPNIDAMARLIAKEEKFERPDLTKEVAAQKVAFERMLSKTIALNRQAGHQGLGGTILLTGATGFLGSFLFRQLLHKTDAKIYCLMRASDEREGRERLCNILERFHIRDCSLNERVRILCGDLSEKRFGIKPDLYEKLARTIDTVFHCGAIVDWMKPYTSLKKTNVGGTVEAIKFCGYHKIKHLNYVSSLAVLPLIDEMPMWLESDQPPPEALTNGYSQSKWVAERLCLEAREQGLPVNIYRFDYVAASTDTGAMKETDFIIRLIKGAIQLEAIPIEEVNFDILSIDYLSNVILQISSLNQSKTYHLINRQPFATSDFTRVIRSFGYKLERISFDVWKRLVKTMPLCDLYPLYPFLNHYSTYQLSQYHLARIDNTNTLTALYEIDPDLIQQVPPAEAVISKTIRFFREKGHLPSSKYRSLLARQRTYWQEQLKEAPARLELPFKPWNGKDLQAVNRFTFNLREDQFNKIESCSRKEGVDVSEIFLAAFQILLMRYTREKNIPVAVHMAVPTGAETLFTLKTPIIKTPLATAASFRDLLQNVRQMVSEAFANLDLPSDEVTQILYPAASELGEIAYDTCFAFCDKTRPNLRLNLHPLPIETVSQQFKGLRLLIERSDRKTAGVLEYGEGLFTEETIARMADHFDTLLTNLGENPDADIFRVPIMPPAELDKILFGWNAERKDYPSDRLVHDLIFEHARIRPDGTALVMGEERMTYKTLEEKSTLLAEYLQSIGAARGDLIGICMDKSFELIIALLGILKADCAYFAIDPTYPEERKQYMVEVADADVILTLAETKEQVPETNAKIICMDEDWESIVAAVKAVNDAGWLAGPINASEERAKRDDQIVYMVFTSGSTGRPKGVKVYHRGLVNMLYAYNEDVRIDHTDSVVTCASLCYDASVIEMFYPLVHGGALVLMPTETARDGLKLKAFLDSTPITFMTASVATWRMLDYAGWQGSPILKVVNGGEALPFDLAQTIIQWTKAAFNGYGPAETSVCATIKKLESDEPITIGRPLANTQIYILDEYLNPMPIGAAGEVYIGGAGVSQGYHKLPEMTAERFIPNPFEPSSSEKIYKTGDLARYLPDGEIDFIGRIDHQIKIRGHRIELGEIESVLAQNDQVKACAVLAQQEPGEDKRLIAYILPSANREAIDIAEVKASLKKVLPAFMLPSDYVVMDSFPMTLGGKVDRTAFPIPQKATLVDAYVAPNTTIELQLADIWREILKIDRVGIHNTFLDLGGDSLSAMKLLIAVNKQFEAQLTIQSLYENLTIAQLAKAVLNKHTIGAVSGTAPRIDYEAETAFDVKLDLAALEKPTVVPSEMSNLFLTGATGFLGAFILQDLLDKTSADIYCLVRADHPAGGMARIVKNLKNYLLWKDDFKERIKPVVGDLALPGLGIDEALFELLSEKIDAIYHCGSIVNFAYPYSFLKKPNVNGTKEIIQFSIRNKIKHLFYVSTIGVFEQTDLSSGRDISENDELPDPSGLFFGYSQSKWIAEKIMQKAMEKGLPISIYRPGSVLGHSITGVSNTDDLVNVIIKVISLVGAIPDVHFQMNGLSADFVADTIVKLSLKPEARGKRFNIINPESVSVKELIDYYISYGYRMPVLPFEEWYELLINKAETNDYLLPYVSVVEKELTTMNGAVLPNFLHENTRTLLKEYDRTAPVVTEALFHTYLKYLEQSGFIPKPDSDSSSIAA